MLKTKINNNIQANFKTWGH